MKNFHIGTITDIPIRLNITLLLFIPVLVWLLAGADQIAAYATLIEALSPHEIDTAALQEGNLPWLLGALAAVGLFASVLLHELGHSWTARYYDIEIVSITLWIFGGMAHMKDLPEEWNKEFWIALAGPVTSVLLGVAFLGLLQVLPGGSSVLLFTLGFLGVINIVLAVFNMLPAFPMDGGRILRALLASRGSYARATQRAATLGKFMAIAMALVGVFAGGVILILVALFVYVAATAESRATVLRELLRGVVVRDLMTGDVEPVRGDDTVEHVVERIMFERLTSFPVVDSAGDLVGMVSMGDLRDVASEDRTRTRVDEVMGEAVTIDPDDHAFGALTALSQGRNRPLVVARDGKALGIVTHDDLVRTLEVIQGLESAERKPELTPDGFA